MDDLGYSYHETPFKETPQTTQSNPILIVHEAGSGAVEKTAELVWWNETPPESIEAASRSTKQPIQLKIEICWIYPSGN